MHRPIVSCLKTSMYRHKLQGLIWFCLCKCVCFIFTLKDLERLEPIDWHHMTDRLQRFELKIFVCVLLKKQSHLHLGCPGGKQINIKFHFWVNYPFKGIVHPKMKTVIIYSHSSYSKTDFFFFCLHKKKPFWESVTSFFTLHTVEVNGYHQLFGY